MHNIEINCSFNNCNWLHRTWMENWLTFDAYMNELATITANESLRWECVHNCSSCTKMQPTDFELWHECNQMIEKWTLAFNFPTILHISLEKSMNRMISITFQMAHVVWLSMDVLCERVHLCSYIEAPLKRAHRKCQNENVISYREKRVKPFQNCGRTHFGWHITFVIADFIVSCPARSCRPLSFSPSCSHIFQRNDIKQCREHCDLNNDTYQSIWMPCLLNGYHEQIPDILTWHYVRV